MITGTLSGSSLGGAYAESHSCSIEVSTPVQEMDSLNDNIVTDPAGVTNTNDVYYAADPPADRQSVYEGYESVTIVGNDSGGISKSTEDKPNKFAAHVTFEIPDGKQFLIALIAPTNHVSGTYTVTVTYVYENGDDVTYTTKNGVSINNGYCYYLGLSGTQIVKPTSFSNATGYWFPAKPSGKTANPDSITIEVKNYNANANVDPSIALDLIFNPA